MLFMCEESPQPDAFSGRVHTDDKIEMNTG